MSKSIRHTPIATNHRCKGQKDDKRIANKKFRCAERTLLSACRFEQLPLSTREISQSLLFVGDGKMYFANPEPKTIRK